MTDAFRRVADRVFPTRNFYHRWLVVLLLVVAAWLRLSHPGVAYFNEFAERDWIRTHEILTGKTFHLSGAELSQGGRLPGPWHYLLQLIPMAISPDPVSLFYFIGILSMVALALAYRFAARFFDERTALLTVALFAVFPMASLGLRYLWNPTLLFAFVMGALYCLALTLVQAKRRYLVGLAVLISVATSFHITGVYLVVLSVAFFLVFRPAYRRKDYLLALGVFVLMFVPFLVGELTTRFENMKYIVMLHDRFTMAGLDLPAQVTSRYGFNPSAFEAFSFNVYPRIWREYPYFGAFSYYTLFLHQFPDYFPAFAVRLLGLFRGLARLHFLVYLVAMGYAGVRFLKLRREGRPETLPQRGALFIAVVLPVLVLVVQSLLVLSASPKSKGSGVHYFFILYPTQFWVMALMLSDLLGWAKRTGRAYFRMLLIVFLTGWVTFQALFVTAELNWAARSGWFVQWIDIRVPNLNTMKKVADVLVDDLHVNESTYITHVKFIDSMLGYLGAEVGIDFLMRIHPGIDEGPAIAPPDLPFYYVIDPGAPHPLPLPEVVTATYEAGPVRILVSPIGEPTPLGPIHNNRNIFDNPFNVEAPPQYLPEEQ